MRHERVKPTFVVPEWLKHTLAEHHGVNLDEDETVECLACGTDCGGRCDFEHDDRLTETHGDPFLKSRKAA